MIKLPNFNNIPNGFDIFSLLRKRRSIRVFRDEDISIESISCLLWAAQGLLDEGRRRTSPSAGALYPISIYLISENISGLRRYIYKYIPELHSLEIFNKTDVSFVFRDNAISQVMKKRSSAIILLSYDDKKIFKDCLIVELVMSTIVPTFFK